MVLLRKTIKGIQNNINFWQLLLILPEVKEINAKNNNNREIINNLEKKRKIHQRNQKEHFCLNLKK